jgi:DNA repair photolyase
MEYIPAKTIITRNKTNSWFGYEYNMNIYRGCCHGCIYCDSRCSCYQIENFDKVRAKENALEIIRNDLRRKVKTGVICSGSMSDPYNPFEKELLLTRNSLELINAYGFGTGIITKSDLVTRDIDILEDIKSHSSIIVKVTITTPHDSLAEKLERGAPSVSKRLAAIKELSKAGIFTGILFMPVLPYITDKEEDIKAIVEMSAEAGAKFIYSDMSMGVTLRGNQKEWYYNKLDRYFRGLKEVYQKEYGEKIYCNSPNSRKLAKVFREECDKYGIIYNMNQIVRESRKAYTYSQLTFFDT